MPFCGVTLFFLLSVVQLPEYMHIVKVAIPPSTILLIAQSASVESA